ncbi:MAG: ABC transporter substrate-binding protein [Hyphomicrobiaceae bacterium]|nr:ABC transporter substrate-binding protein [Hyphomicrobiaceae bacterium]
MDLKSLACPLLLAGLIAASSPAAAEVRVGFVTTLSGPSAVIGQHMRDGFLLGLASLDGKLGGEPAEAIVVDDELKPDVAVARVKALIERDRVDFIAGLAFSNVLLAVAKPVFEAETFLIGANAGPSVLAGKGCSPWFFSTSFQNDQIAEVVGTLANARGYRRMALLAPNYQAGRDMIAGFKRTFAGEVVEEIHAPMGALDFSAELARIASLQPDAFFSFMPGGMGVQLVKQVRQSGINALVPFISGFVIDEATLPATGEAALGLVAALHWSPSLDNPENRVFVERFEARFGYVPSYYAAQGYDAARLIDGALTKAGGKAAPKAAIRQALASAPFKSVRGAFRFNGNGFPIQDFHEIEVERRADGKFQSRVVATLARDHADAHAGNCKAR